MMVWPRSQKIGCCPQRQSPCRSLPALTILEDRIAPAISIIDINKVNDSRAGLAPANLTAIGDIVYFKGTDTSGSELWRSDGTEVGTFRVKDINPGFQSSNLANLVNRNGTLFFTANDGTSGTELWKSDGTDAGTVLVRDINPGISSFLISNLTLVGETLFFTANQPDRFNGIGGMELWKSDGTTVGREFLVNTNTYSNQSEVDVAALPDGGFIATWTSYQPDWYGSYEVYAQRYDAGGQQLGDPFRVNTSTGLRRFGVGLYWRARLVGLGVVRDQLAVHDVVAVGSPASHPHAAAA